MHCLDFDQVIQVEGIWISSACLGGFNTASNRPKSNIRAGLTDTAPLEALMVKTSVLLAIGEIHVYRAGFAKDYERHRTTRAARQFSIASDSSSVASP